MAGGAGLVGRGDDLLWEVHAGEAEQPGGSDDCQGRHSRHGRNGGLVAQFTGTSCGRRSEALVHRTIGRPGGLLTGQLGCAVGIAGVRGVGGAVRQAVCSTSVEHLICRNHNQGGAGIGTGLGHLAGRRSVAAHGQLGVASAAVDVRPCRAMNDHVRPV